MATDRLPQLLSIALADAFEAGIDLALRETDLPLRVFPSDCPFSFEDMVSDRFLCDTSQDWPSI